MMGHDVFRVRKLSIPEFPFAQSVGGLNQNKAAVTPYEGSSVK
jgi:hypothetical protein